MNGIRESQIDRLNKYKSTNNFTSSSIIQFDIETLRMIASYVLTINPIINRQALSNVSILFDTLDLSIFNSDIEKNKYIDIIIKGVKARLSSGSDNIDVIKTMIRGGIVSDNSHDEYTEIFKTIYCLNIDEIKFVNGTIESCLSYLNISNHAPRFIELLSDIENNKSNAKVHELIQEFNNLTSDYVSKTRSIEANMNTDVDFMLSKKELDLFIDDYLFKCDNMADKIITGMQEFNNLIGGGFERERCYVLAGLAGTGKSMVSLNLMLQIMEFNRNIKTLDKSKKPCIVFITQENSTFETMERFLNILGCKDPKRTSRDEIMYLLNKANIVTELDDESENDFDFQILIKFIPGGSQNTDYLYTLYDDLNQKGYEVVVLVQDHIKKMRSALHAGKDLRIELGEVVNEFKTFATIKKCAVITVTHLNRSADTKIRDSIEKGSLDPLKDVGRDAIGESYLLIDNSDCCLFLHKVYDTDNTPLMSFNRVKERFEVDPFKRYIAHPMEGPTLLTDLHLPEPLSRMSVNNDIQNSLNVTMDRQNNIHNTIGRYDEKLGRKITENDIVTDENLKLVTMSDIFGSGNSYSGKIMDIPELSQIKDEDEPKKYPLFMFYNNDKEKEEIKKIGLYYI